MLYSFPGGIFGFANLRVSEIVVLKSTQKGLPAPDSDVSYNCGFSKGKWPSASHHNGATYKRHPWRLKAMLTWLG